MIEVEKWKFISLLKIYSIAPSPSGEGD